MRSKTLTVTIAASLGLTCITAKALGETSDKKISISQSELAQMKAQILALEQKVQALEAQQQAQVQTAQAVASTQAQVAAAGRTMQKAASGEDKSIHLGGEGGIRLAFGGFLAAESIYRSKNTAADIGSNYNAIPYANSPYAHTDEFAYSARQSRLSILARGDVTDAVHLAGYYELDFLGGAQTANMNESNSFNLRTRHLYATVDWDTYGLHFLAGQDWSLLTLNSTGIVPRSEVAPLSIDAQYVPGFAWARQTQARIVKDWNKQYWLGFSIENSQTLFANGPNASKADVVPVHNIPAGSGYDALNTLSLNHLPDLIVKFAADPGWGHYEVFALGRDFYSRYLRVGSSAYSNHDRYGGGFGLSMILPLLPKQLDFIFSGMKGKGIGRYGSAQLPDVTFANDGHTVPLKENMLLAGLTWHATSELDVYAEGGREQQHKYVTGFGAAGTTPGGWGNPLYVNSGCFIEDSPLTCIGETRQITQGTLGMWWRFYQGKFGKMQLGAQYSYTIREAFNGVGGAPKTSDNMFFTSLRYYPF